MPLTYPTTVTPDPTRGARGRSPDVAVVIVAGCRLLATSRYPRARAPTHPYLQAPVLDPLAVISPQRRIPTALVIAYLGEFISIYSVRAAFPASSIHFQAHRVPFAIRPPSSAVCLTV
ncbi:hypothetical protein EYR38_005137 [Pleurotus pulmonarius]|nr:hypothetical protein EYR38_005137 [Pleurotus pulmonarius]